MDFLLYMFNLILQSANEVFLLSLPNEFFTKIRSLLITFGGRLDPTV